MSRGVSSFFCFIQVSVRQGAERWRAASTDLDMRVTKNPLSPLYVRVSFAVTAHTMRESPLE